MKLTPRQKEVLLAYAEVDAGELPKSIRRWIDGAPTHQKWGCRLNGVIGVIDRLKFYGLVELEKGKPCVHAVRLTDEGRALAERLRGGKP